MNKLSPCEQSVHLCSLNKKIDGGESTGGGGTFNALGATPISGVGTVHFSPEIGNAVLGRIMERTSST
jgi:hypothetical protein